MNKFIKSLLLCTSFAWSNVWAVDTYNPINNQLIIPIVQVGSTFYKNVVITVGSILRVSAGLAVGEIDLYDPNSNQLTIPSVVVGSITYNNVVITVDSVVSVGSSSQTAATDYGKSNYVFSRETPSYALDTKNISYPASFTVTATPSQINTDPCNLDITTVTYPKSYIGNFPLPEVKGAPFDKSVVRGVWLVDAWGRNNPTWTDGCQGDARSEFTKSVLRIKSLGAEWIVLIPWTLMKERSDGSWYIMPQSEINVMPDDDLEFAVKTAKAAGLKVHWRNQIQGLLQGVGTKTEIVVPSHNQANMRKFIAAYKPYMEDRATVLQRLGVDAMDIDCSYCWTAGYPAHESDYTSLFVPALINVSAAIKGRYQGKTSVFFTDAFMSQVDIFKNVDIVNVDFPLPTLTDSQLQNLNVSNFKSYISAVRNGIHVVDSLGKIVIFSFAMDSRLGAIGNQPFVEGSHCTATATFTSVQDTANCIQRTIPADFSAQAIVFESILEEIKSIEMKSPKWVFASGYSFTDFLMPTTAFPNINTSFRNKPAEGILKSWFAK